MEVKAAIKSFESTVYPIQRLALYLALVDDGGVGVKADNSNVLLLSTH